MTYNFDPDRWRDDQLASLELERKSGRLSGQDFEKAAAEVERRYERMLERLDSTFQLPPGSTPNGK